MTGLEGDEVVVPYEEAPTDADMKAAYQRGYDVGWRAALDQKIPAIGQTQITAPTFLTDAHGVAWWIDPTTRRCQRVD